MKRKIGIDAFEFYLGPGMNRSHQAVADHYRVSKRAVTAMAKREDWRGRMASIEAKTRERSDDKAAESLEAMRTKHLKIVSVVQGRALEALRSLPLNKAMDAVRAIDISLKQERLVMAGPAGERTMVANAREYAVKVRDALAEMEALNGVAPEGGNRAP